MWDPDPGQLRPDPVHLRPDPQSSGKIIPHIAHFFPRSRNIWSWSLAGMFCQIYGCKKNIDGCTKTGGEVGK